MKYSRAPFGVIAFGIIGVITLVSFISIMDVTGPKTDAMVADWERAKAYTMEYLDAANDEVISFKPTPDMRSFGQQMLHIAESNYGFGSIAAGKESPVAFGQLEKAADDYKTKEALKKAVMDSYDYLISALKGSEDSKMTEGIKMFNRFEMSREAGFQKAFEHQTHHRGQTTVYLRLKGIKPPNEKLF
jgi:uncharacterized damage-inducible protein DinB